MATLAGDADAWLMVDDAHDLDFTRAAFDRLKSHVPAQSSVFI